MIKLMILGRRAPGLTRRAAHAHLRDVHGPMVVAPPAGAGAMPSFYAQNHVLDGVYPGGGAHAIERDLFTELHFDSFAALTEATTTRYYLDHLRPDEPNFVDDATVERLIVDARPVVPGPRARFKLFVLLARPAEADDGRWPGVVAAAAAAIAAAPGVVALTENSVTAPPGGGPRFVDLVFEAWLDDRDAAFDAALRLSRGRDAIDPAAITLVAEEFSSERLRRGSPG